MRCYGAMVLGLAGLLIIGPDHALADSCMGVQSASVNYDRLKKAVDPENKMGESTRILAAVGALYQFKMNKGDTDGAACVAFQMIQHYRVVADKYAALTACALQKGDMNTGCHAAMKSYANVLNGKSAHIEPTGDGNIKYVFTDDATSKVMQQGIEPPDKLAAAAMGFAQVGFDKTLFAAAEPETKWRAVQGRSMVSGKSKAMLDMPPTPTPDMPAERPRQPMNCVTMQLDSDISTTNCN
jgi:hypothetical protein